MKTTSKSPPPSTTTTDDLPSTVLSATGAIASVNRAFEELFGCNASSAQGKRLGELVGNADSAKLTDAAIEAALEGKRTEMTITVVKDDGRRLELDARFSLHDSGHGRSLLVVFPTWREVESAMLDSLVDALYEISLRPFGILRRAVGPMFSSGDSTIGRPCYEVLYGRSAPCTGCPARDLKGTARTSGIVRSDAPGRELCMTLAQRIDSSNARLSMWTVDAHMLGQLVDAHVDLAAERAGLTEREGEVLRLALVGRSSSEMAKALGISPSTAKFHMANVLAKLGAESRLDLLRKLY